MLIKVISIVVITAVWGTAVTVAGDQLLDTRVARFEFHGQSPARGHVTAQVPGGMLDAAMALAFHTNVRICIEEVPRQQPGPPVPIEVSVRARTVGEILQLMVNQDPRYTYRERLSVVEVLPV